MTVFNYRCRGHCFTLVVRVNFYTDLMVMFSAVISGFYVMATHKDGELLSRTTVDISRYRCLLLTSRIQTLLNDQNPRTRNRYGVKGTPKCELCRRRKLRVHLIALLAAHKSASFWNQMHHVHGVCYRVNIADQNNPRMKLRDHGITRQTKFNFTKT